LYFGLNAWSHNYAFDDQDVRLAFDNLSILQGEVICPDGQVTPTATMIATAPTLPATMTASPTPETYYVRLPAVRQQPTATPTSTPTPTRTPRDTATPTSTPTVTPTEEPRPTLADGSYVAALDGGADGWIRFRIIDNGTRATSAGFLISHNNPLCYPIAHTFGGSTGIGNGRINFVYTDGVSLLAQLTCVSKSATTASCRAFKPFPQGVYAFCGIATGMAHRQ
jgi:hypothetical protein